MKSLSGQKGSSPTINTRVKPVRKAQIKALAEYRRVLPSQVIQDAIDSYIVSGLTEDETKTVLRVALKMSIEDD